MPNIIPGGNDGSNSLQGTAGADIIYGYDPNGPQGQASAVLAIAVATGFDQPLYAFFVPGPGDNILVRG